MAKTIKIAVKKSTKRVANYDTTISSIEKYLNGRYDFRHNPILERTEFKLRKEKTYRLLSERDVNSICRELNNNEKKCSIAALRSLLNSDFVKESNPFINYFEGLPKWNGKIDYIEELAQTIKAENQDFWVWSFKKWLVNLVACAMGSSINQQVLVFVGKQGLGKTTWLNKLVPAPLQGYLYCGVINPSNKDTLVNLSENIIINLDELENLNKSELGSLKSLITQSAIRLRRAYGIYNENFVRRASFVGSVNEVEFLTDTTGNRRYLVIDTTGINYNHKINFDNVYSQAYALLTDLKYKFNFVFADDDIEKIDENNQKFIRQSIEEELLLKHYRRPEEGDKDIILLTTTDVLMDLQNQTKLKLGDPSSIRRLGNALQKYKFQRVSKGNSKPYQLVSLTNVGANNIVSEQENEVRKEENTEVASNEIHAKLNVKIGADEFAISYVVKQEGVDITLEIIEDETYNNHLAALLKDQRAKAMAQGKVPSATYDEQIAKLQKERLLTHLRTQLDLPQLILKN
ncbi:MAG: virulence-associated family protein [Flavipsychrobacter sp.]|jgi:hypothetical protein|nr:virulence-associated family protein [Flavipsychrobacter sp.]